MGGEEWTHMKEGEKCEGRGNGNRMGSKQQECLKERKERSD